MEFKDRSGTKLKYFWMDNEVRTRILTMRNMTSLTANYSDDARKPNGTDDFVLFILTSKYILLHRRVKTSNNVSAILFTFHYMHNFSCKSFVDDLLYR